MEPHIVDETGHSRPMTRIRCKDEVKELQQLLHLNSNLLAGDQINPDDPRRWLLIKREMPVPNPNSGDDRWSIDFLYADQDAMPTFVECKRFRDTRARREVVGQMLEYAANGQYYWTKADLQSYAKQSTDGQGLSLEGALQAMGLADEAPEAFFERVWDNLQDGKIRLIFFMEETPPELASIVDFLNRQMQHSEVLLMEVRQYVEGALKIAVPALYGYTEEARSIKQAPAAAAPGTRRKWDEARFFEDAERRLTPAQLEQVRAIYSYVLDSPYSMGWGTGARTGSFGPRYEPVLSRMLCTIWSDGHLQLNFGWYTGNPEAEALRDTLKQAAVERLGLAIPAEFQTSFPTFSIQEWGAKAEALISILSNLVRAPNVQTDIQTAQAGVIFG